MTSGVSGNPFDERVLDGFAEAPAEGEELGGREALVAEEEDEVLEPCAADRRDRLLVELPTRSTPETSAPSAPATG